MENKVVVITKLKSAGALTEQSGYTLLEIMLTIALITLITMFSLGIYQQQATNFKVDKTALQMQQWLQAAMAYYVDHNNWPDGDAVVDCKGSTKSLLEGLCGTDKKVYIQPGSIDTNAWGKDFLLLAPAQQANPDSNIFIVETGIAASGTQQENQNVQLAQRVASRLPNATIPASAIPGAPIAVQASVTVPGPASNAAAGANIQSVTEIKCPDKTGICAVPELPTNCPANTKPALHVALQSFDSYPFGAVIAEVQAKSASDGKSATITLYGPDGQTLNSGGSLLAFSTCDPIPQEQSKKGFIY